MKTCILATALLSSSALAFQSPSTSNSINGRTTNLSMAKEEASPVAPTASINTVIKVAANGMSLLRPIFAVEANIQASLLATLTNLDKDAVASDLRGQIVAAKKEKKALIYTYGLSPFSSSAIELLDSIGYQYTNIELGLEWFLLGPSESEIRMLLSQEVNDGATSLPKIFIGEECIGGYKELCAIVESGEVDALMKKGGVAKQGSGDKKMNGFLNGLFM
jgi:glutaredoxin